MAQLLEIWLCSVIAFSWSSPKEWSTYHCKRKTESAEVPADQCQSVRNSFPFLNTGPSKPSVNQDFSAEIVKLFLYCTE